MKHPHIFFIIALFILLTACAQAAPESAPAAEIADPAPIEMPTEEPMETDAEKAQRLLDAEQYEEAYALLLSLGFEEQVKESEYERAVRLYEAGDYAAASALFADLDYRDSADYLQRLDAAALYAALSETESGETLCFGTYEQDGNLNNGAEPIEWLVLDKQEDHILLLSLYALDRVNFASTGNYFVSWENSAIRQWLNGQFYPDAFSETEKLLIAQVDTGAEEYALTDDESAADRAFLLSVTEVERYLPGDAAKQCYCTQYASDNGSWHTPSRICRWWLRTAGVGENRKAGIRHQGTILRSGFYTYLNYMSVRPALCLAPCA